MEIERTRVGIPSEKELEDFQWVLVTKGEDGSIGFGPSLKERTHRRGLWVAYQGKCAVVVKDGKYRWHCDASKQKDDLIRVLEHLMK